jgi:plasmid maintenance system antidote protein VapI
MTKRNNFQPDWGSMPGETIADILEERNLSREDFARCMGYTVTQVDELLCGHAAITSLTAQKLETVLGGSTGFWITRESQYREHIARLKPASAKNQAWINELPVKDMIKFGWLPAVHDASDKVSQCLRFFAVPDVQTWRQVYSQALQLAAFRTSPSFKSKPGAVAAWLRQGEIESESIDCKRWDAGLFEKLFPSIRALTWKKDPSLFTRELQKRCARCGVAVVIVRAPDGCRASGATRFLSPSRALLLLSFRYLSDDHFWFTFFHEAGHLLLHSKNALFLEGADIISTREESEANDFAAGILIPAEFRADLLNLHADRREVIKFARRVKVSPGIVVGQLQHLGLIPRNQLNGLKRRFRWPD